MTRVFILTLVSTSLFWGCGGPQQGAEQPPKESVAGQETEKEPVPTDEAPTQDTPDADSGGVSLDAEPLGGPWETASAACDQITEDLVAKDLLGKASCELGSLGTSGGVERLQGTGAWLGGQTVVHRDDDGMEFMSLMLRTDSGWYVMPAFALAANMANGHGVHVNQFTVVNIVGDETPEVLFEMTEEDSWTEEGAEYVMSHTSRLYCAIGNSGGPSCIRVPVQWKSSYIVDPSNPGVTETTIEVGWVDGKLEVSGSLDSLSVDGQSLLKPFLGSHAVVFP